MFKVLGLYNFGVYQHYWNKVFVDHNKGGVDTCEDYKVTILLSDGLHSLGLISDYFDW